MKYAYPKGEAENFPNKLGITDAAEIGRLEASGFALAEEVAYSQLKYDTVFNLAYLYELHSLALAHLYEFAGRLRTVDMSKGGFRFPSAFHLPQTIATFEKEHLLNLPLNYELESDLINDIGRVHAELLFIHPFRDGNGRTARLLANLMALRVRDEPLDFRTLISEKGYNPKYLKAVQRAGIGDYSHMQDLMKTCFYGL